MNPIPLNRAESDWQLVKENDDKIYVYLKGRNGQLCGYYEPKMLPKLVEHFIKCEKQTN